MKKEKTTENVEFMLSVLLLSYRVQDKKKVIIGSFSIEKKKRTPNLMSYLNSV
jgi:hypothetical protein